jgi:hypothetical protein
MVTPSEVERKQFVRRGDRKEVDGGREGVNSGL